MGSHAYRRLPRHRRSRHHDAAARRPRLPQRHRVLARRAAPYVTDLRRGLIRSIEMLPNGLLAKQTDRVFADLRGAEPGAPDGMKVDTAGNVYCGGAGGLAIIDPKGKTLGRIVHGHPETTNLAFGGDDWKTLFITTRNHLSAVKLKIAGVPVPPPKKS